MLLVINSDHISEVHVCWYTKPIGNGVDSIALHEVVERHYAHPHSCDECTISVLETIIVDHAMRSSDKAAEWILLEACQKTIHKQG